MTSNVVGFILAGGQSRRMAAQDKCLLPLGNKTVLDYVISRARPQVNTLVINANGDPSRFDGFGLPVVGDIIFDTCSNESDENYAGPLAGILTGMEWVRNNAPSCEWLVTFPSDTPFIADDVVRRLNAVAQIPGNQFACAKSNDRVHYALGLWPVSLYEQLKHALLIDGVRKTGYWISQYQFGCAEYPCIPYDPFLNINYPEDLQAAQRIIEQHPH